MQHKVNFSQLNEVIVMKFVKLCVRTEESVKTVSFNIDAIQSVEQLRTAFPHELSEDEQASHRAVMTYDSEKGWFFCNVRYTHSRLNIVEYIPAAEDCQAVYVITLNNGSVHICQDDDLPVAFAELLGF